MFRTLNYYLNQPNIENHERWRNVEELITSIEEYCIQNTEKTLSDFLEEVSLLTDMDRHNQDYDSITLMTIHSAKGLEYSLVFIVGLEEGLFPITSYSNLENDIDEGCVSLGKYFDIQKYTIFPKLTSRRFTPNVQHIYKTNSHPFTGKQHNQ